jgi:hypothetical protein
MERVAVELGRIGFANMMDYMRVNENTGLPEIDFSGIACEMAAAVTSLQITDKGTKFTLSDKRAALMDIAKLFGWIIIEKRENKIAEVRQHDHRTDRGLVGRTSRVSGAHQDAGAFAWIAH